LEGPDWISYVPATPRKRRKLDDEIERRIIAVRSRDCKRDLLAVLCEHLMEEGRRPPSIGALRGILERFDHRTRKAAREYCRQAGSVRRAAAGSFPAIDEDVERAVQSIMEHLLATAISEASDTNAP
jgi:hypothetical protein